MSTQDVKLPATVEEFQKARRSAFLAGAYYNSDAAYSAGNAERAARREFPIRTTKGERVAMNGGWLFFDADGHLRWESEEGHFGHVISPSALENLRANPFTETDE